MVQTSFLTLRLHGSIPAAAARELQDLLRQARDAGTGQQQAQKQFFARFDAVLDQGLAGPRYLEDEKVAEALAGEIMMLEEIGFTVPSFAILPTHAHAVLELPVASRLSFAKALDLLHLRTGQVCRRLVRPRLPAEAEFWQAGWFDYAVADEAELGRIREYVWRQAETIGLPARFREWPYVNE